MKAVRVEHVRWPLAAALGGLTLLAILLLPPVRELFILEGLRWVYIMLVSFGTAFTLTPVTIRLGHAWGLVDEPDERKIHWQATPRIGGLAVYLGFSCSVLINGIVVDWMAAILLAGSLLFIVGVADDRWNLPAWSKLGAQLLAAGIVILSGKVLTLFPPGLPGDMANLLMTLLWIVGITNAFNFFDGMDGLAAGLAVLMAFFMGVVAFETNQPGLGWLAVALIGAGLGFLPFNFRNTQPALVFLGDGGATFLGFTLACLAVKGNWADNNPIVSFSNPLLIFGLLIYDMIHITVERLVTGKVTCFKEWIEYVGKDHLHHRLERAVGSRRASVAIIFALTICLGLAALMLRKADTGEAIMLLAQATLIVLVITILEHRGRRAAARRAAEAGRAVRAMHH